MLRLTLLLCCTLFLVLLIGGRDYGQMRPGLAGAARLQPDPQPVVTPVRTASLDEAAPALTVAAEARAVPEPKPETAPVTLPERSFRGDRLTVLPPPQPRTKAAAPDAEARDQSGIRYVTAEAVNVRSGPSTAFPVIGRLTRGEAVLVDGAESGRWTAIRIEGDGLEGFMAARYLAADSMRD
ncbi:SH3 domain-containing protein [Rhodobacter sp. NSM]|uniref:SH3 domain-containing protein n=1 Tax=Rhodobacter sp. NSM TaxID=3457501 RepID=UPI003FD241A9